MVHYLSSVFVNCITVKVVFFYKQTSGVKCPNSTLYLLQHLVIKIYGTQTHNLHLTTMICNSFTTTFEASAPFVNCVFMYSRLRRSLFSPCRVVCHIFYIKFNPFLSILHSKLLKNIPDIPKHNLPNQLQNIHCASDNNKNLDDYH